MRRGTRTTRSACAWMAVIALGAVLAACEPVSAQWLQWGGPTQGFEADSKGLAKSWPEEGPPKLWQRDLGEGYSAILVDGDRLFTMYRGDEKETVICLDAASGKTVWEREYDSKPAEGHEHGFGDGPRSTPLIVGDRLYAVGVAGKMHCLNKQDGTVYWSHDLWKDFGGSFLNHGYSSSPIAYQDTIIVLNGGEDASLIAFDKLTGGVVWKNLGFKNSYSTPKLVRVGGKDQLITFMANEIIGVDPANGNLAWRYEIGNQWGQNVCMPTWYEDDGILFFSTTGAGSRGLKLTRNGDKTEAEELWSSRKVQFYHVTSVRDGDHVFGSTGNGPAFLAAINGKTGKVAWRERGFAKATCVKVDGRLIILDEDGQLALATATPDGLTVHSKVKLLDRVAWTVPTIVGKTMYVRNKKTIMALDLG